METVNLAEFTPDGRSRSVALGNFDGVHHAHRIIIEKAVSLSPDSSVFTFSDEPEGSLTTSAQKAEIFGKLGIKTVFFCEFSRVRDFSPERFVNEILIGRLGCTAAVCGFNYRFGKNAAGDSSMLGLLCREKGITQYTAEPYYYDGALVSSSRIRGLLAEGNAESASKLLGRYFFIEGKVMHGYAAGRKISVPTLNIAYPTHSARIADGVYASLASAEGKIYESVTNIGMNPTLPKSALTCETHLINADADLYGKNVTIHFCKRLRGELALGNMDELKSRISHDIDEAKVFFRETDGNRKAGLM